ncbi:uncharacterized protein LOC124916106 [Impatiens glandulifera]|uniref:uncharacterized protein LOC124916106 n=1 Tax=Impatiens glandulifera TaxID=253017 RepID=UPI001FB123A7|nr:uncharacterized protein LOC124916106 [Impatiens glandulifera]
MGKKLDALLGKIHHRHSKMKTLAKLAACRLVMIKNQRQIRSSYARSDVAQLLCLGHQERALLRVEHLIEEQNKLDAFVILDDYFHVLQEKASLVDKSRECPEELKEAMSSLIYAASRCSEFPELQEIRNILTSKFGNEFAVHSIELRKDSRVNPKIIQKLSIKQTSRDIKLQVLREIALDKGIDILSEGTPDLLDSINGKKYTDFATDTQETIELEPTDEHSNNSYDEISSDNLRSYKSEVEETDDESKSNVELGQEEVFGDDVGQIILQSNEELVFNRSEDEEDGKNVDGMKLLEYNQLD